MHQTPLPFDEQQVMVLMFENLSLNRSTNEVRDNAVHGHSIAFYHDSCLPGGHKLGVPSAPLQFIHNFDARHHFTDAAIVSHGMDAEAIIAQSITACNLFFFVPPDVNQLDTTSMGGIGEFVVVGQEIVQAGNDIHTPPDGFQNHRPPGLGHFSAGRRDANQQRVGSGSLVETTDNRDFAADPQYLLSGFAMLSTVEHSHHIVRAIS